MDEATAFGLLGEVVSLTVDGRRFDGVMVAGHKVSSTGPGTIDLVLPTRVGEPENRIRLTVDRVELAPDPTPGSATAEIEDSYYEPFASFAEWETAMVSSAWADFLGALDLARSAASPEEVDRALEFALRSAALETGAIEGLYATSRGVTRMVALQGAMWEAELDKLGSDVRGHFAAQLAALELVLDVAMAKRPMTLAWLRSLHAQACANQKMYKLYTPAGVVEHPLEHGAYKTEKNNVSLVDGLTHWYCEPEQVGQEMTRLKDEMNSPAFERAHPVVQAAYAHNALTAIHPFSDGNGRTARALASMFLYRAARIPLVIFSDQDEIYLDSLSYADRGHVQSFVTFIEDRAVDAMGLIANRLRDAKRPLESRAAALRQLVRAHGGLTLGEVAAVALRLTNHLFRALPELVTTHISAADFAMSAAWRQGHQQCDYGAPYHTLPDGGAFAIRIESKDPLLPANVETTPFIGIANDPDNTFAFIAIDANRPRQAPLKVRIRDLHPSMSHSALELIDGWVRQTAGNLLDDLTNAVDGSRQAQGIQAMRVSGVQNDLDGRVLRAIIELLKDRPADDRRVDTSMVLKHMGLGEEARDEIALSMSDLIGNGDVTGSKPLTGDGKVIDVTVTGIAVQGLQRDRS